MTREEVYALVEGHYREKAKAIVNRLSRYLNDRATAEDVVHETYARCCQYWRSYEVAEDIAHNAYIRCYKYWATYDGKRDFNAWFNTILNNSIKDSFRVAMAQGMALEAPPPIDVPRSQILDHIEVKELLAKIDANPPKVARILRLFLIDGYYSHEITEIVNENASTIRKVVQRFRDGLRS